MVLSVEAVHCNYLSKAGCAVISSLQNRKQDSGVRYFGEQTGSLKRCTALQLEPCEYCFSPKQTWRRKIQKISIAVTTKGERIDQYHWTVIGSKKFEGLLFHSEEMECLVVCIAYHLIWPSIDEVYTLLLLCTSTHLLPVWGLKHCLHINIKVVSHGCASEDKDQCGTCKILFLTSTVL